MDDIEKLPLEAREPLVSLVRELEDILGDDLVGIYLYGSLALGTFNPVSSDADVLVVIKKGLQKAIKTQLADTALKLQQTPPGRGFEINVITLGTLEHLAYPPSHEFHFNYTNPNEPISDKPIESPSLVAHIAVTKKHGRCLYGEPIPNIFPDVSRKDFIRSVVYNAESSLKNVLKGPDTGTCAVPNYAVLNACRVLEFIDEGRMVSKTEGGVWALKHLPQEYTTVIEEALKEYAKTGSSHEVNAYLLKQFIRYTWEVMQKSLQ